MNESESGATALLAAGTGNSRFVDVAIDLARAAGRAIMAELPIGLWRGQGVEHKSARELVSRVDRAAESLIVEGLREAFPDHVIQGEEGGLAPGADPDAPWRWHVDPIDGTTNFVHGHAFFCVSVALERRAAHPFDSAQSSAVGAGAQGRTEPSGPGTDSPAAAARGQGPEIVAAVVYLPYFDELFFAERSGGAFLNTRNIALRVSATAELSEALVATGFAYERDRYPNYDNFERVARQSLGIRRCGSAAIDLAFVAAGRYDAYWELGLRPHDVAAGALLVEEAGGRVTDLTASESWLDGGSIVASNGLLHETVRALLDPRPTR